MARVSAPIRPPHMPRQWPPPSRPRMKAEISCGARTGTGLVLITAGFLVGLLDAGLVLGIVVVEQDAVRRAVQVVVLAAVDGPEEQPDGQADDNDGHGNHVVQGGHGAPPEMIAQTADAPTPAGGRARRRALSTTSSELMDMPSAAQAGVTQPRAAKGRISPWYSIAQLRFSMMVRRVRRARGRARVRLSRRLESSTASALVLARSVAEPMATLMSAAASTGTSLTPSPSISTLRPSPCSCLSTASLSSGVRPPRASSMPN